MSKLTSPPRTDVLRRPAWLLIATLPAYIAFIAAATMTLAKKAETSAYLTPADIDALGVGWMAPHVLWVVPPVLAAIALTQVARIVPGRATGLVPLLAVTTISFSTAYLVINLLAYGSATATWGANALYPWSNLTSLFAGWFGVHVATLTVVAALIKARVARKTAIAVGVLYAAYFLFEVLIYLPVIFGPDEFAGFMGGLPPFLLGFFWAVLGGALLRDRVDSRE